MSGRGHAWPSQKMPEFAENCRGWRYCGTSEPDHTISAETPIMGDMATKTDASPHKQEVNLFRKEMKRFRTSMTCRFALIQVVVYGFLYAALKLT